MPPTHPDTYCLYHACKILALPSVIYCNDIKRGETQTISRLVLYPPKEIGLFAIFCCSTHTHTHTHTSHLPVPVFRFPTAINNRRHSLLAKALTTQGNDAAAAERLNTERDGFNIPFPGSVRHFLLLPFLLSCRCQLAIPWIGLFSIQEFPPPASPSHRYVITPCVMYFCPAPKSPPGAASTVLSHASSFPFQPITQPRSKTPIGWCIHHAFYRGGWSRAIPLPM